MVLTDRYHVNREGEGHINHACSTVLETSLSYPDLRENNVDRNGNIALSNLRKLHANLLSRWQKQRIIFRRTKHLFLLVGFLTYFGFAMYHERLKNENSVRLLWLTCFVALVLGLRPCRQRLISFSKQCLWLKKYVLLIEKHNETISWCVILVILSGCLIFVFVDTLLLSHLPFNLVSAAGLLFIILLMVGFSKSPTQIYWRPVVWGIGLQLLLGLMVLRWPVGRHCLQWFGHRISELMSHAQAGAVFLFGKGYKEHFFVFQVSSVIAFFGAFNAILFHLGVIQALIDICTVVVQYTMRATGAETLNATANIFLGMTQTPLLIRHLISSMTSSELHCVLTSGFATIGGGSMATYILLGIPASHLLTASVMSAPAAIAVSKLLYPEVEKRPESQVVVKSDQLRKYGNLLEAASCGAMDAGFLIAGIFVNLLAFVSLLELVNSSLDWFGDRIGVHHLTFQYLSSYALFPLAMAIGTPLNDCRRVAELLGIKLFINEFVSYTQLNSLIENRHLLTTHLTNNGSFLWEGNDVILLNSTSAHVLQGGVMTERSEVITAYALCGYANFSSIGIALGGMAAIAPERIHDLADVAVRAMLAGTVACLMTACVAGMLYQEP